MDKGSHQVLDYTKQAKTWLKLVIYLKTFYSECIQSYFVWITTLCALCILYWDHTDNKSRVEVTPEVETFPYILDNTRECHMQIRWLYMDDIQFHNAGPPKDKSAKFRYNRIACSGFISESLVFTDNADLSHI